MIGIHEIHRKLAKITEMATGADGYITIGRVEVMQLIPLLRQNLQLIQQLDGYKQLAFHAYEMGDFDWMMELTAKIEKLEEVLEI